MHDALHRLALESEKKPRAKTMSTPAASADAEVEAALAALPPPTEVQRRDMGWSRDWSEAWAAHERKLVATYTRSNSTSNGDTTTDEASAPATTNGVEEATGEEVVFTGKKGRKTSKGSKEPPFPKKQLPSPRAPPQQPPATNGKASDATTFSAATTKVVTANGGGVEATHEATSPEDEASSPPSVLSAAWKSREDLVSESGGRIMFFDLTGGPTVRLAKERAMVGVVGVEYFTKMFFGNIFLLAIFG